MTTLKELFMSRACKFGLAVLLAASMVPVAALSTAPAFAEDSAAEQAKTSETATDEQLTYLADSTDEAEADDVEQDADSSAATADEAAAQPAGEPIEGDEPANLGEGIEGEAAPEAEADEAAAETEEELSVSDFQLESLETTVETPFSFWAPFRLLFGADASTFTVPLKSGNYINWIDRLDLSGAPYARNFYDILVEASDNDGTKDWLIDNIGFSPAACTVLSTTSPASRATVGNVYKVDSTTSGILAAIIDDNEAATATSALTETEQIAKKYINETYGAFDRDYPSSFWRDVSFGTVFVRDKAMNKTLCFFALKGSNFDLRASGYRSSRDIKAGITTIDSQVTAINNAFTASDIPNKDTDYARVKFYNYWICKNNSYNSRFAGLSGQTLKDFQAANPDVWSAMSALSGRKGATGPVCEGYSRAMQLLCQRANIGCVVVDGNTDVGPHMWNYVRMGSGWYGLDITWNDGGDGIDGVSPVDFNNLAPCEKYFLVGTASGFVTEHPVSNQFVANGTKFTNGPMLSANSYDPNNVTFAGIITTTDTFAYGDSFALDYTSTTPGDVSYEITNGSNIANIAVAETLAETAKAGSPATLNITGVGAVTVKVTLTPTQSTQSNALTDTITINAGPRPLRVTGTVLATRMYNGTNEAAVQTGGTLVTGRPGLSYATAGLIEGDTVGVTAKSARYDHGNAGENCPGSATYELTGDASTLQKYTLASDTDTTATGTITKRPATAYFALTSTRMLLDEEQPKGTVRYEQFTTSPAPRGVVEGDDLVPTDLTIRLSGLPANVTPGTYDVTWAKPNAYVLDAINALPAAANYDIELATGDDDETVQLEVVNLANTVVVPAEGTSGGATYRVEARVDGINNDTVTKLADADSNFSSTESIVAKLLEALQGQTDKIDSSRVAVYDMTLYVKDEKGAWEKATSENFPTDGVRVTLDYPENTAGTTHAFYAAHMFTSEVTSGGTVHRPGEVETPQVLNGNDGPNFVLMGFSPVSLAWEEHTQNAADNNGLGAGITQVSQNTHQTGASAVSQTGDSLPVLSITVVALACIVLIVALMVRRNRSKKGDDKN